MAKRIRLPFRLWEVVLILFALALLGSSVAIYWSGISLRSLILGLDDGGSRSKIGVLASQSGVTRRQFGDETEFRSLTSLSEVFNQDTIVTESSGSAIIQLDQGSSIELGPSTMVRLAFETSISLGGITRAANVEVVSGEVSGKSDVETTTPRVFIKTKDRVIPITKPQKEVIKVVNVPKPIFTPPPKVVAPSPKPLPIVLPSPSPTPLPSPSLLPLPSPKPSPRAPLVIRMIAPAAGERFSVVKREYPLERVVELRWEIKNGDPAQPLVVNRILDPMGKAVTDPPLMNLPKVAAAPVKGSTEGVAVGTITVKLLTPGKYQWKIGNQTRTFELLPEVEMIEILDPLVGGESARDNAFHGKLIKDFGITLQWSPVEGISTYRVKLSRDSQAKNVMLEKSLTKPSYSFNNQKTLTGTIYYKVSGLHASGFMLTSPVTVFSFSFMPPKTVMPPHQEKVQHSSLIQDGIARLLITWEKTNFTSYYELVIASDPAFRSVVVQKTMRENFWIYPNVKPGTYWWRVRGISEDRVSSHYSKAAQFTVQ